MYEIIDTEKQRPTIRIDLTSDKLMAITTKNEQTTEEPRSKRVLLGAKSNIKTQSRLFKTNKSLKRIQPSLTGQL